ncbi:MAG: phosphopantothenoylcysteine decarboxylase [Clostridiales Family XIII bacterium]|jgi:phosphopantothenoylcysteine decarboxylase/phosphopantothenoylcysteine decarboxylase/phosphopantothenate--cysteine ligase|nr:phosphopantothenoylcysteine decarboxylase [Clostridiales Family XIII bacterium]
MVKKHIVLGVTGSIAAYKAADLANNLTKKGHEVAAILTRNATEFISPLTFQTLTKRAAHTNAFEKITDFDVDHVGLAKWADILLIAPATANIIGKIAAGIADDMLTTVIAAAHNKPVVICPAMNTAMYENPIICENIKNLSKMGYLFIEPRESVLACGDLGKGALADIDVIIDFVERL